MERRGLRLTDQAGVACKAGESHRHWRLWQEVHGEEGLTGQGSSEVRTEN